MVKKYAKVSKLLWYGIVEGKTLAEEHPSRLESQYELAIAYQANGQIVRAVKLPEHVVTVEGRTLAEERPSRLASRHAFAGAYQANGQITYAVVVTGRWQ
jgi:hypothetical protein